MVLIECVENIMTFLTLDSVRPGNGFLFSDYNACNVRMVPTGTRNQGKPGKMGRHFPVRKKSGNFVKTGKVREFYSKYWKNQKKLYLKIEKNT